MTIDVSSELIQDDEIAHRNPTAREPQGWRVARPAALRCAGGAQFSA